MIELSPSDCREADSRMTGRASLLELTFMRICVAVGARRELHAREFDRLVVGQFLVVALVTIDAFVSAGQRIRRVVMIEIIGRLPMVCAMTG